MSAKEAQSPAASAESTSQTERVVLNLRQMLLRGQFRPGERLAELTLVPLLNASRTPVRLALERLSHQGLLEALPNGGFRVREFTVADIWDAIEIRGVLEGTAARFAAERLTSADELSELRRSYLALKQIVPENLDDFVPYVEENEAFHRELWRLSKSPMLMRALEAVSALPFAEPGALVFGGTSDPQGREPPSAIVALEHHRAILEAIENREGSRAESLAREHSRMARRNLAWALRDRELLSRVPGASLIAPDDWPEQ